jgi:hypothetical protein
MGFLASIGDLLPAGATTTTAEGSTNATALSIEFSESWQQDIEHAIIAGMSCPQCI